MKKELNKINDYIIKRCEDSNRFAWKFAWLGIVIITSIAIC